MKDLKTYIENSLQSIKEEKQMHKDSFMLTQSDTSAAIVLQLDLRRTELEFILSKL